MLLIFLTVLALILTLMQMIVALLVGNEPFKKLVKTLLLMEEKSVNG